MFVQDQYCKLEELEKQMMRKRMEESQGVDGSVEERVDKEIQLVRRQKELIRYQFIYYTVGVEYKYDWKIQVMYSNSPMNMKQSNFAVYTVHTDPFYIISLFSTYCLNHWLHRLLISFHRVGYVLRRPKLTRHDMLRFYDRFLECHLTATCWI